MMETCKDKTLLLKLPPKLHLAFKVEAAKRETTMRALIIEVLEEHMVRMNGEKS